MNRPLWKKALWPVLVVACLNLLALAGYTWPQQNRQRRVIARLDRLRADGAAKSEAATAARARRSRIESNRKDAQRLLSEVLPGREPGLVAALAEIESLVTGPGLQSKSRGFTYETLKDSGVLRMVVTVPMEGGYRNLVDFLLRVERSKAFLTVDSIAFQNRDGKSSPSLQLGLSAWFRPEEGSRAK